MGLGQFFDAWFRLCQAPMNLENFSTKLPIFSLQVKNNLFGSGQKNSRVKGGLAPFLLWVKSMLGSGQVRPHLYAINI